MIELLIVIVIAGSLAAYFLYTSRDKSREVKQIQTAVERCLQERRTSSIRLYQAAGEGIISVTPVEINFLNPATTAPLRTEGVDANNDGIDDNTRGQITKYNSSSNQWNYGYDQGAGILELPKGWMLVGNGDLLMPEIPNSEATFSIRFDESGRPADSPTHATPSNRELEAPFWAIYFLDTRSNNRIVAAVAVHGSGMIEIWNYDPDERKWRGFGGRE